MTTPPLQEQQARLSRVLDYLADASQFAREASHAAERGRANDVVRFARLAKEAAEAAAYELGMQK